MNKIFITLFAFTIILLSSCKKSERITNKSRVEEELQKTNPDERIWSFQEVTLKYSDSVKVYYFTDSKEHAYIAEVPPTGSIAIQVVNLRR